MFKAFLDDIDRAWRLQRPHDTRLHFHVFGSAALLLQESRYRRGTKDADILETAEIIQVHDALRKIAGRESLLYTKHRIYLEVVSSGIPFLPHPAEWLPWWPNEFSSFDVSVLAVSDVVVSKLIRFSVSDQDDIQAMIDGNRITHDQLLLRLRTAIDYFSTDARASHDLPLIVENFNSVERDFFGITETRLELPSWI